MLLIKKEVLLPSNIVNCISFSKVKNNKYFLFFFNNLIMKYLLIPKEIKFKKFKNLIVFEFNKCNLKKINCYVKLFLKNVTEIETKFQKKIILRGLGYKISKIEDKNQVFIRCKVGLSNLIYVNVPIKNINIINRKNSIVSVGYDKLLINNFCKKIKNIKKPNSYSGRGFWYKHEKVFRKPFKKK